MDNGEVIPGLNEDWTLGGAKLSEWMAGFVMLVISQEIIFGGSGQMGKYMPMLMTIWLGTTFGLAALRRQFPDEERGVRNKVAASLGVTPPGLPPPARVAPRLSGMRMEKLDEEREFTELGLHDIFPKRDIYEDDEEEEEY